MNFYFSHTFLTLSEKYLVVRENTSEGRSKLQSTCPEIHFEGEIFLENLGRVVKFAFYVSSEIKQNFPGLYLEFLGRVEISRKNFGQGMKLFWGLPRIFRQIY